MKHILNAIIGQLWSMTPDALESIIGIVNREMSDIDPKVFHVSEPSPSPVNGDLPIEIRGNVGILTTYGPIIPRATMFSRISGAASIDVLTDGFLALIDNPAVDQIIHVIDSPGGAITGVSDFADMIYEARQIKPVTSFITGMGASGGYWLAAPSSRIVVSDTALVGSIGVVAVYTDTTEADSKRGVKRIEIISSQSPHKRESPSTDTGRVNIQKVIDDAASVFIGAVAKYRGVDVETVMRDYGQGGMKVGQVALDAGMVDGIGTLEKLIDEMQSNTSISRKGFYMGKENIAAETVVTYTVEGIREGSPETFESILSMGRKEGVVTERERIKSILALSVPGAESIVPGAIDTPDMTAEKVALQIIKAQADKREQVASTVSSDAALLAAQSAQIAGSSDGHGVDQTEEEQVAGAASGIAAGANARRKS